MIFRPVGEISVWIRKNLLWDDSATRREGFWSGLWAARRLFAILVVTAVLTWREWVEHHPPEIAIVALLHFLFVFVVVALFILVMQWSGPWFGRPRTGRSGGRGNQ
jgi:NhaP-type Na+/H+ or K+/H+ antiporter